MKLRKILLMGLSMVLVAVVAIGGTLAYLTMNAGNENNVFSVGNINISLDEEVGVLGEGGEVKENTNGAEYIDIMPGDYLKKKVTVSNNGKTDAYVAVTVTINNANIMNTAIDNVYGDGNKGAQAMYDFIFDGWRINQNPRPGDNGGVSATGAKNARGVIDGTYGLPEYVLKVDFSKTTDFDNDTTMFGTDNWFQSTAEQNATKNGKYSAYLPGGGYHTSKLTDDPATTKDERDYMIVYTYYMYLPAGEASTLFNGLNVPAEFNAEQLAMFDGLEINVEAKAIQADNMAIADQYKSDENGKAKTAFAILAGDIDTPEYSNKPTGKLGNVYTSTDRYWGEHGSNATESHVIKFYNGKTYMGETSLNNINGIIDGDVYVTWSLKLNAPINSDGYWSMKWEIAPTLQMQPNRAELWVDGMKVDESKIQMNGPDNLNPIGGVVTDTEGRILRYVVKGTEANTQEGEIYTAFVSGNTELDTALKDGATSVVLTDGTYNIPASAKAKTLTITGAGPETVIEIIPAHPGQGEANGQLDYNFDGSTVTFNNLTIKTNNQTYAGYARLTATYNDCVIENMYCLNGNSVFNNCVLNVSGDAYNIWTWGADIASFTDCTFNCDGKSILVYNQSCDVYVDGCTFNDRTNGTGFTKSALETGVDGVGPKYNIYITDTTVNGFAENDKCVGYKNVVGNKNSMTSNYLNIVVDNVDVY